LLHLLLHHPWCPRRVTLAVGQLDANQRHAPARRQAVQPGACAVGCPGRPERVQVAVLRSCTTLVPYWPRSSDP